MILYEFVKSLSHFFVPKKRQLPLQGSLCRTTTRVVPTVVSNYRFKFLRLAKDCKGLNHINNSQKIEGIANAISFILGGEQGIFRRTAVRLRIASLFNHGLSNSPPDCFHRQSRPSLFESLAVLSTKNKGYSKCYTLCFWRRARDSNPRNRFGGLHDFQSCSFDQLGQLSVSPVILYTIV